MFISERYKCILTHSEKWIQNIRNIFLFKNIDFFFDIFINLYDKKFADNQIIKKQYLKTHFIYLSIIDNSNVILVNNTFVILSIN